jgi:predicted transcriptional regulator
VGELPSLQGELQSQIMTVLWRLEDGTVEQVRTALPARYRTGYNTIQTVLNRLVGRGLLSRERRGNAFAYSSNLTEAEYLSRSIQQTLAGASADARHTALRALMGDLQKDELTDLQGLADEVSRKRR